jgi:hypothetical protein
MVRLLSRQHGRNRPLHLQDAVKTAVAQTGEDVTLQSHLRVSCVFFARERASAFFARRQLRAPVRDGDAVLLMKTSGAHR